jgi:hypothetical protein
MPQTAAAYFDSEAISTLSHAIVCSVFTTIASAYLPPHIDHTNRLVSVIRVDIVSAILAVRVIALSSYTVFQLIPYCPKLVRHPRVSRVVTKEVVAYWVSTTACDCAWLCTSWCSCVDGRFLYSVTWATACIFVHASASFRTIWALSTYIRDRSYVLSTAYTLIIIDTSISVWWWGIIAIPYYVSVIFPSCGYPDAVGFAIFSVFVMVPVSSVADDIFVRAIKNIAAIDL